MNISTVNEIIQSLESAGEPSIREQKFLKLAKAYQQLAAENVVLKESRNNLAEFIHEELDSDYPLNMNLDTPATDRIYAGIKADAAAPLVSALKVIANSEQHNGDTVVCDFDTLISVAACALRDYYAQQLREGAK
ncbi:TPA: hypothetical protein QHC20_003006 [Raoultella ornithinolytica]|nr:hypothetical protein [Raoultella ornithinolytica]HDT5909882.1 hypothetical protein [Raoultella ornithinolytica]HDT5965661.1 hypothetical protein [Raoultella ornithinolytica]HDT6008249.1 hypothetical protein [Raoultella ornithinolytica]HDT6013822.1 hypothetical protein [Raoultella ornithinolytica]